MTLKEQIADLKEKLAEAKRHTYVTDTTSLHCSDGELIIEYDIYGESRHLIIDVNCLYEDLPFIINKVCEEQKKMQKETLNRIKEELKEI